MIFIYFFILSLVNAKAFEGPSYRSSVMEGDKPILRMPPDPTEEEDSADEDLKNQKLQDDVEDEKLARDMSLLIAWLVEKLGYNLAQDVRRVSDYPEKKIPKEELPTNILPEKQYDADPVWLTDLKAYMKDLISQYGKTSLNKYTEPVIKSLEKKEHVIIKDIDVDQYGEVFVHYDKNVNRGSGNNHSTQSSEESNETEKKRVERVTKMPERRRKRNNISN